MIEASATLRHIPRASDPGSAIEPQLSMMSLPSNHAFDHLLGKDIKLLAMATLYIES